MTRRRSPDDRARFRARSGHSARSILFAIAGLILHLSFLAGCLAPAGSSWWADAREYIVAADHPDASAAGAEILAAGGNAVDAAVATSFALSVVRPESCGIGGGGFMLIQAPGRLAIVLDYRETAPRGAGLSNYLDDQGKPIAARTRDGPWAVAVPGTVRGLLHALETYGSGRISRAAVLAPAIRLAGKPLIVDRHLHGACVELCKRLGENPEAADQDSEIRRRFTIDGQPPPAGSSVDRSDMAVTLRALADSGDGAFYQGSLADQIIRAVQSRGGVLSVDDLRDYQVRTSDALHGSFGDYEIIAMPPPSSGGAVIIETLHILGGAKALTRQLPGRDPAQAHVLVEALKHAFAERAACLGDRSPEVMADVGKMINPNRAARLRGRINPIRTQPAEAYGSSLVRDDSGTSHFCVVDREGMAVACTETINLEFGSMLMVPDTGIILNNEMDDFAVDTATPNAFGLRQSARNLIKPGRRPLSSMSPTILLKDGKVQLIAGASGGPRIITSTIQVILNTVCGGESIDRAVAAPRLHHQWMPDAIYVSSGFPQPIIESLLERGHAIRPTDEPIGHVQAIARTATGWRAACDPDKGGAPAGR